MANEMFKLTRKNLETKLGITDENILNIVDTFRNKLPILTDDGEGFCVNARDLYKELMEMKKSEEVDEKHFSTWMDRKIHRRDKEKSVRFKDGQHYIVKHQLVENSKGGRPKKDYMVTMDTAKNIALLENNKIGDVVREYFIALEKILKLRIDWVAIRIPEKESWKKVTDAMVKQYNKLRGENPGNHSYMNEANFINGLVLGCKAKEMRELVGAKDKHTRDWLPSEWNDAIYFLEEQDVLCLGMDMEREERWNWLTRMYKSKYGNLRPFKEVWEEMGKPKWNGKELVVA